MSIIADVRTSVIYYRLGLGGNFDMVKKWLGNTLHTHDFGGNEYPHQQLFNLLAEINYSGWILLEESTDPADKIELP